MTVFASIAVVGWVALAAGQYLAVPKVPALPAPQAIDQPPPAELPIVSMARIRRKLERAPVLRQELEKPVYRMEVFGRQPTIEEILGPDYLKGPVSYGGISHQEFLNMVTPKDVQGYAAFSNKEGFVVAATSIGLKWALQKAIGKLQSAKEGHDREAARREVQDALAALQKARRGAGLPDK